MNLAIVGHTRQHQYFKQVIANQRLSHAYCFNGSDGIGKYSFAKALARHVMCQTQADQAKFDSANHPDIHIIRSDSSILTEQINNIHEFIFLKPLIAPIKVLIIDDAANMVESAQNKLLKVLEEPPGHALIILVTNNASKLLQTIRSRAIQIAFNPLKDEDIHDLCALHQKPYDFQLAKLVNGSYGDYLKWTEDNSYQSDIVKLIELTIDLLANQPQRWLANLKHLEAFKTAPQLLFNTVKLVIKDAIIIANQLDDDNLQLPQYTKALANPKIYLANRALYGMIDTVAQAQRAIDRGQNYSLISEGLWFKIQEALHG